MFFFFYDLIRKFLYSINLSLLSLVLKCTASKDFRTSIMLESEKVIILAIFKLYNARLSKKQLS